MNSDPQQNKPLSGAELVNPYDDSRNKGEQVEEMFDSIAPAYDFMNTAMSMGLHRHWRRRALNAADDLRKGRRTLKILDIATGTGDVAFDLYSRYPDADVTGVDLSDGMLGIARRKLAKESERARRHISFEQGDSLNLRFADNTFDLITVAYGVRNFEHLEAGLREMARVLRHGGTLCIIELSCPTGKITRKGYNLYTGQIIPRLGRMISGDSRAYSYLPESIAAAPQRAELTRLMEEAGLSDAAWKSLTMGVITYYTATKK
ncbi:MAG: bifunctional demethylmenaquinone methyltransferase/2-methoxy-6-polyprenyl-1,4-benzoquinol methylase UbiE [Muribaculaceae bacterium]|nr:bifunctional demethylmenaquinone methyltransferase/2-methoxy-6-polyprenyl-1,4-benzoquinol methylase UbiE [Muribaculaceae bacterium]